MTTFKRLILVCIAIAIAPQITMIITGKPLLAEWVIVFFALIAGLIIGMAERFFAGDDIKRMPGLIAEHSRLANEHAELQQALDRLHDVVATNALRQRSGKDATDKAGSLLRRLRQREAIRRASEV